MSFAATWVRPGEHYVKRNKPGTERQMPWVLIYVEAEKADLIEGGSRTVVTKDSEGWGRGLVSTGMQE